MNFFKSNKDMKLLTSEQILKSAIMTVIIVAAFFFAVFLANQYLDGSEQQAGIHFSN